MNARFNKIRLSAQQGAAAVEFALLASLYIFFMVSAIELGLLFFVNLTMQHAVRQGARYAVTGRSDFDPDQANQQRYRAIIAEMHRSSMGYFDPVVRNIVVSINGGAPVGYGKAASYTPGMFGGPGDIVVLRLDCEWQTIMPIWRANFAGGVYAFSVATTMRTESY